MNPATNQLEGFDIDIAKEISRAIFGDYGHIELKVTSATQPIPALRSGSVDMVARTLQRGDVDAVSTDEAVLLGFAAQDPGVMVVGDKFTDEPYALGISQTHSEFLRFVNAVLERLRADGTWTAIYNRWLSKFGARAAPPPAEYKD